MKTERKVIGVEAQVDVCRQINYEGFESYTRTKDLNPETTVKEILQWYESDHDGRVIRLVVEYGND